MKLPPSIEALIPTSEYASITRDMVENVAYEACRLQREADEANFETMERTPLVVSNPTEKSS